MLAQALVPEGLRNLAAGANPMALGAGMAAAAEKITAVLREHATPVDGKKGIASVGAVASRDQEIGDLIGEAMDRVGEDGVITVEESSTLATELEITEGLQFDKGYLSPYFVTDSESMEAVLEDAHVLLHRDKISSIQDLLPLLEKVVESGKPLLVVAEDLEGEALSTVVVNAIRKTLRICAVKAPFFGDRRKAFLDDLAAATGATVINPEIGLKLSESGLDVLGTVRRAVITKDATTLVEGGGDKADVEARVSQIRREIDDTDSDWDKEKLSRAAREALRRRRGDPGRRGHRDRAQGAQAPHRGRGRRHPGRGRGGHRARWRFGAAARLGRLADGLGRTGDEATGVALVRRALAAPLKAIASNAGLEGSVVAAKVAEGGWTTGYDAATEKYGDLMAAGIIDPVKVTRSALENAVSIARMVLTTESAIVDKPRTRSPPRPVATATGTATGTDPPSSHARRARP